MCRMRFPQWLFPVLLFFAVALSRTPFLDAGYGTNIDGWRVARAARIIAATGEYETSRFPGSPVEEIISAPFVRFGPVGLNALSAVFSVIASIAIWRIALRLRCRDSLLVAVAFAFTPIIFLSSVIAKDYVWAIAFALLAFWMVLEKRPLCAGLLLGLAVGCRITSGAMLLPLALIHFYEQPQPTRRRQTGMFVLATLLMSALCYLPVWLRYGTAFFTFYDNHARPDLWTLFARSTFDLWGSLGLLGLTTAIVLGLLLPRWRKNVSLGDNANPLLLPALVAIIALYLIAYLRLPDQAGYLVPVIPAVLLLAAHYLPRPLFQIACITIVISPWIDFSRAGIQPGMIIADHRERERTIANVSRFVGFTEQVLPGHNVVVVGGWEPMIAVLRNKSELHNDYRGILTPTEMQEVQAGGYRIAYTTDVVRAFNLRQTGVDLDACGAIDLRKLRIALNR